MGACYHSWIKWVPLFVIILFIISQSNLWVHVIYTVMDNNVGIIHTAKPTNDRWLPALAKKTNTYGLLKKHETWLPTIK